MQKRKILKISYKTIFYKSIKVCAASPSPNVYNSGGRREYMLVSNNFGYEGITFFSYISDGIEYLCICDFIFIYIHIRG